jgi:hypothetical protein
MARTSDRDRNAVVFRRVELDAAPEDPIVRAMLRHGTELEPDPRFARRLRGIVLSRHVATREGYGPPVHQRTPMTPIGRGVLIGTVLVAMSAGGVGAFSQSALPDDPLYPLKLRLEAMRMAVAPADMQDDLLRLALDERVSELKRAADAGRWAAAEEAAWRVAVTEDQLVQLDGMTPAVAQRIAAHLHAIDQVMAHAPAHAAARVAERLDPARDALQAGSNNANGNNANGGNANGGSANGGGSTAPTRSAEPTPLPRPSRTPTPLPTHAPAAPSARPVSTEAPAATPRPTPPTQDRSSGPRD